MEGTSDLRSLSAEEFEWLVGERKSGRRIVQCERWESREVGVGDVREFAGTLMRAGCRGKKHLSDEVGRAVEILTLAA
jgi:hypothetical protein